MTVYEEVRRRDMGGCRACGVFPGTQVHHIVFRSQGGPDIESNLILLCDACHDLAHNRAQRDGKSMGWYAPWELQMLVWSGIFTVTLLRRSLRHGKQLHVCWSCERRSDGECLLWDEPVDWDYWCSAWRERDDGTLAECLGERMRDGAPARPGNCASCYSRWRDGQTMLHPKDAPI